jgi:hypothetical protein
MKLKRCVTNTLYEYYYQNNLIKESIYDFKKIPIDVTEENYREALALRERYKLFKNIGVATFLSTTFLWRVVDENEFQIILKTGKITGGDYAVPAEKLFGASYGGSREEVLNWGLKVKSRGRYSGQLYIFGINAEDKEFLNLNMVERLAEQGIEYQVGDFTIDSKLGDVGLGFSVRDVDLNDVRFIYKVDDETKQLTDVTFDYI